MKLRCVAFLLTVIHWCQGLTDDDLQYVKCFSPQRNAEVDCMPASCVEIDVAAIDITGRQKTCVCAPWNSGAGCQNDVALLNDIDEPRLGWNAEDFVKTGHSTDHRDIIDKLSLNGIWSVEIQDFTFEYRRRNLIGIYLVGDLGECKSICEQFNPPGLSYDACGSVVYHKEGVGKDAIIICEVIAVKPVRLCEKWLKPKEGWTVVFLAPKGLEYGCY